MEFLMQSIASHDRQIGELAECMERNEEQLSKLGRRVDALTGTVEILTGNVTRFVETSQLNFDRLTTAMLGLDFERRFTGPCRKLPATL